MMVGLDIDGVVADFLGPFLKILAQRVGTGRIDPLSITDPSFIKHPSISNEIISQCMIEVSYQERFWEELEPLPTTKHWRALDVLSRDKRLVFITHRYERDTYSIHKV